MTDGFARRKEQSKEDIRKAAWELFGQFGVEKVSIADIARKAGVAQATIYNNFASKEALAREYVAAAIEQLVEQTTVPLIPEQPFRQKLESFIAGITALLAQGQAAGAAAPVNASPDLLNDPEIRAIRAAAQERMTALLLNLIREGKAEGQIRPELSEDAYRVYFKAFMDVFIDPQFRQMYARNPTLARDLGAIMVNGLSGR